MAKIIGGVRRFTAMRPSWLLAAGLVVAWIALRVRGVAGLHGGWWLVALMCFAPLCAWAGANLWVELYAGPSVDPRMPGD